jgi:hypothetical protein
MSFPDLALRTPGPCELWAEATGVPAVGANTFQIPFAVPIALGGAGVPAFKIEEDWLEIDVLVDSLTPGVTFARFTSLSLNKQDLTMFFETDGFGPCRVVCRLIHTVER